MDTNTVKKLDYILSGYKITNEDKNDLIELMEEYHKEQLALCNVSWHSEQLPDFNVKGLSEIVKHCKENNDDLFTLICSVWNKGYMTGVYQERQIL